MKKSHSQLYLILAFIFAQIAWLGLLGLWINWYVSNYIIFEQVGDKLSPQIVIDNPNVLVFVGGIILIVGIAVVMFIIFRNLTIQTKLTNLYDNFISNITHELKSPLSSIQLYLETLDEKNVPPEKQKEFYSHMKWDTNRLNKLINSILDISRIEQKRIAHDFHIYDFDNIVNELITNSKTLFRLTEKEVSVQGSLGLMTVLDKQAMQIVFDNLFDNAIKYSDKPVSISVKYFKNNKNIVLDISDKGVGILPQEQKKVFHKFYRINVKENPNVKGTGLGLYWVKEIIRFHSGKISCFNNNDKPGSTFRITLPVFVKDKKYYFNSIFRNASKKEKLLGN